ncbi:MAG: UDP-N-acetylglucosamine--N-acetylmuramyl-(pentapeptide) pyrophosphoryl-undecaprenol N-acetylglucosamine transferase, partial [Muribaculaceae bacterium]|nr:UDP-N-acetylglucosamine--N-acetylmuramyl-(pentapeptide) pyrophosphoryl-undecaprenol N-acetylglucosamine transferase [Muribaculaceae bacterium]
DIEGLEVMGFARKRLWRNFKVLWKLYKSRRKAKKIIRDFDADIAVGVGGYASGPTLMMAQKLGIPTLIQEQNSYAGVTNKHLGKGAGCICVAYENMDRFFPADKIVMTGNPVREAITACTVDRAEAKRQLGFDPGRPLVAVVGGSLGARTINEAVKASMYKITAAGAQILWQTGKYYADDCIPAAEGKEDVKAMAFVSRMDLVYRAADLIVSRAGASTISELQLVGTPAILIPSPNVAEDHQRKNAMALVDHDAAVMILDADATGQLADTVISLLADKKRLATLAANVKAMGLPAADDRIVDHIYALCENPEKK